MKNNSKIGPFLLIALIIVLAFPITTAAARPAPSPAPATINIIAEPSGPLELTVGKTTEIKVTSDYINPLNWAVVTNLGTASMNPVKTVRTDGVHSTTLTVSSAEIGAGKVSITATDSKNKKIKTTISIYIDYVQITEPPNNAPVFGSGTYTMTTEEDTPGNVSVIATDPDNDALEYTFTQPAHGVMSKDGTTYTYTPAKDYSGADDFTVTASDGKAATTVTVGISVSPVNDAPVAANDTATGNVGNTIRVFALANDTDIDTESALLSIRYYGSMSGITITKGTNYFDISAVAEGIYTFQYTITDGLLESNLASVTITFTGGLVYVALGDSIPDGYYNTSLWNYLSGGTNSYSYIEQFRDALGILSTNYYDESVSGYNSIDVRNQLSNTSIQALIAKADVITLCVGGNDIMDAAPRTLSGLDKYNVDWAVADQGRDNFEANWVSIVDGIEELNPDVTLIVMTVYNTYRTTETIYETADSYFEDTAAGNYGLNYIIRNTESLYDAQLADEFDYRVADVYHAFNDSANKDGLTGFYSSFCDPHPNQYGQNLIFAEHYKVYQ
jgi:lysophospholipase L1-like esterase